MSVQRKGEIVARATEYFVRTRSGVMSAEEGWALKEWLGEDSAHQSSFEEISALWAGLDAIHADPAILALREDAKQAIRRKRFALLSGVLAVAACLLLVLASTLFLVRGKEHEPQSTPAIAFSTRVGQISRVALADGSIVTLDTDSAIRYLDEPHRRSLKLLRGRALFKVAKDRERPFVVDVGDKSVTAVGTEFDVYRKQDGMEVTLFSGQVRVVQEAQKSSGSGNISSVDLVPGYRLIASQNGQWDIRQAGSESTWSNGLLVFEEAPVADIVAELNRYSDRKMILVDPVIGEKRMSAVLRNDDGKTFVAAIEAMELGRARLRNGRYELSAN